MVRPQGGEFLFAHALAHRCAIYAGPVAEAGAAICTGGPPSGSRDSGSGAAGGAPRPGGRSGGGARADLAAARSQAAAYRYETAQRLAERGARAGCASAADRFALGCLLGDILHGLGAMPAGARAPTGMRSESAADDDRALPGLDRVRGQVKTGDRRNLDGAFADLERAEASRRRARAHDRGGAPAAHLRGNLVLSRAATVEGCH